MAKFIELGYELLPHPPYPSDLAPRDYFLLSHSKRWLDRTRFSFNDESSLKQTAILRTLTFGRCLKNWGKVERRIICGTQWNLMNCGSTNNSKVTRLKLISSFNITAQHLTFKYCLEKQHVIYHKCFDSSSFTHL